MIKVRSRLDRCCSSLTIGRGHALHCTDIRGLLVLYFVYKRTLECSLTLEFVVLIHFFLFRFSLRFVPMSEQWNMHSRKQWIHLWMCKRLWKRQLSKYVGLLVLYFVYKRTLECSLTLEFVVLIFTYHVSCYLCLSWCTKFCGLLINTSENSPTVASSNPGQDEAYSIQHYVIKFVSDRWVVFSGTPVSSTNKTHRHDITEILFKVVVNTIILT
jgi:hypothetical protein